MKILRNIFILVVILAVILLVAQDIIIKYGIEKGIETVTGLPASMQSVKSSLANTTLGVEELRLHNPKEFKEDIMAEFPEIYVDYRLKSLLTGKIYLNAVRVYLRELTVIKNANGQINIESLKPVRDKLEAKGEAGGEDKDEAKGEARMPARIGQLSIRMDRVVYIDYEAGAQPTIRKIEIGFNETYRDVDDIKDIVNLVVYQALTRTAVGTLEDFGLDRMRSIIRDTVPSIDDLEKGATDVLEGGMQKGLEKTRETIQDIFQTP